MQRKHTSHQQYTRIAKNNIRRNVRDVHIVQVMENAETATFNKSLLLLSQKNVDFPWKCYGLGLQDCRYERNQRIASVGTNRRFGRRPLLSK